MTKRKWVKKLSEERKEELKLRSSKPKKEKKKNSLKMRLHHLFNGLNKKSKKAGNEETEMNNKSAKKKTPKARSTKQKLWMIAKIALLVILVMILAVVIFVFSVISKAEKIDTSDISSLLSQSSFLYDDAGEIIDTTYASENRTIVELKDVPDHVQKAFIALEDRKFEKHHGINFVRMVGAVVESVFGGGEISGTSTITQQLARNVFLTETMSDRTLNRKITEIYYAFQLEDNLTKDQILEGYLNTINFGLGYGIGTVAQTYFSKEVSELTVAEGAALATLPQAPSLYALVKRIDLEYIPNNQDHLISQDDNFGYIWNDAAQSRMGYCLRTMKEMGYITEAQYNEASKLEIKDIVNPNFEVINNYETNYFSDYVINQVIHDLQEEYGYDYSEASEMVYSGGLRIYTTLDSEAQAAVDKEVDDRSYYPELRPRYDKDRNILQDGTNNVLLYNYSNYFDEEGVFTLRNDEYTKNPDGSIRIKYKGRIAFYPVTYNDVEDVNLEFRNMYMWEDDEFYTILGGVISVPRGYKTLEENNDVTISADFFKDYPDFFKDDGEGNLSTTKYTLRTKTIQPQIAVTVVDNETGAIKAMCGGRETNGRQILNRAEIGFQPGSSIKPVTAYGAALQNSYNLAAEGKYQTFVDTGYDLQKTSLYGNYITAASLFDDEPTTINGEVWPKNDDGGYSGLVTFRTAIQQSINIIAVKLVAQMGYDFPFEISQLMGYKHLDEEYDKNISSLAIGGTYGGVSTIEAASGFSTFVNNGIHKTPYCYEKVTTRSGSIILEPITEEVKVFDEGVAWIMRDVLQSVVQFGTPRRAQISGEKVGGKTGTTDIKENLWFTGFTANYSASIWIGPDVRIPQDSFAANTSAKLFSAILSQVPKALGGSYTGRPSNVVGVEVDALTGYLPSESTTETKIEFFTRGTEPTEAYSVNSVADVCTVSGKLAGPNCDVSHVIQMAGIKRPYAPSDKVEDLEFELPHEYCDMCTENSATYSVYLDLEENPVYSSEGYRIVIRNKDKAFVSIDTGTVIEYEKDASGNLKLDEAGFPIPANLVKMINVVGQSYTQAEKILTDNLGLIVKKVEQTTTDASKKDHDGVVYNQSIPADSTVIKGSTVTLSVYKYKDTTPTDPTDPTDPSDPTDPTNPTDPANPSGTDPEPDPEPQS